MSNIPDASVRKFSVLRDLLSAVLAVVFPSECALCGDELAADAKHLICGNCWSSLQPWLGPKCTTCGLPFASPRTFDSSFPECSACRKHAAAFDGARSFGIYSGKLRQVVLRAKFSHDERLGVRLGESLALTWESLPKLCESPLVIPIPLHHSRRRERGFNQAEQLAGGLVLALGRHPGTAVPQVEKSCLRRKRATPPQTGLSASARRENLRGAFEVMEPDQVRGRGVVLIDDVMTTGATLSECAHVLKRAGAAQVLGLTLARATAQFPDLQPIDTDNTVDGFGRDWR